jgi:hypothetical protein
MSSRCTRATSKRKREKDCECEGGRERERERERKTDRESILQGQSRNIDGTCRLGFKAIQLWLTVGSVSLSLSLSLSLFLCLSYSLLLNQ